MRQIVAVLALLVLSACVRAEFQVGDVVITKIGNMRGQVLVVDCLRKCDYWVRFVGQYSGIHSEWMKGFELEKSE